MNIGKRVEINFYNQLFDLFKSCKWYDFNLVNIAIENVHHGVKDGYWLISLGLFGLNLFITINSKSLAIKNLSSNNPE